MLNIFDNHQCKHCSHTYAIVSTKGCAISHHQFGIWIFSIVALGNNMCPDRVFDKVMLFVGIALRNHIHVRFEHNDRRIFLSFSSRNAHKHVARSIDLRTQAIVDCNLLDMLPDCVKMSRWMRNTADTFKLFPDFHK